jgi:Family of unknown function (DUF6364)
MIYPITLDAGKRLFTAGTIPAAFKVTESNITSNGVIVVNYERAAAIASGNIEYVFDSPEGLSATEINHFKSNSYIPCYKVRMKSRITITLDPIVVRQAKNVARERQTNLSALIEGLLKQTAQSNVAPRRSFTQKWAGKLTVREDNKDELLKSLKTRYGLEQ